MITNLSVRNFKSWKRIESMRLAPLTGLFGTNSSGKTSILQLFLMLKQTFESSDRSQVLEFGDEKTLTDLGSFRDIVYSHERPGSIEFSLTWRLQKTLTIRDPESRTKQLFSADKLTFDAKVSDEVSEKLGVEKLEYRLNGTQFVMNRKDNKAKYELHSEGEGFRFKRTPGRVWDLPAPVKFYGFPDQVYAYFQNAGFLSDLQLSFENLFGELFYLGPLREFPQRHYQWSGSEPADMGRRGERVVDAILAARQRGPYISPGRKKKRQTLEERVAYWLKRLGLIHDFTVQPISDESSIYQVRVRKTRTSADVLITDVGFGVSQILPVLALCYYVPEGSTIILEQPEIHLHPSVQSGLADVFIDAMKNRHVQIILESHSEHLLRRIQRRIAEEDIAPTETALYFCEIGEGGSTLSRLNVDLFGNIKNWPKDFFGDEFSEMSAMTKAVMERKMENDK